MTDYAAAARALQTLRQRNVTILGEGPATAAHALCLRDCGIDVRLGMAADDAQRAEAEAEGFAVKDPYEACEEADLIMLLAPAERQQALYEEAVADNLVRGDVFLVGDGFALRYGLITPPAEVDVGLVVPVTGPERMRREFAEGRGVPTLVAVAQDASGTAWDEITGYAAGLGGLRAGIVQATVAEVVDAAAFGAAAVSDGGIPAVMRAAFDALVAAGYEPEVAYLACVDGAQEAVDAIAHRGLAGFEERLAPWPGYLAAHTPEPRFDLAGLLERVRSGELAERFLADGAAERAEALERSRAHGSEDVGRRLRGLMPWLATRDARRGQRWR